MDGLSNMDITLMVMIIFASNIELRKMMQGSINITFPDGRTKKFNEGSSGVDVVKTVRRSLAKKVLAIEVNGEVCDLARVLPSSAVIKLLTWEDAAGKAVFWHSTAHLLGEAVLALYPDAQLGIGPPIEQGFYYDVDFGDKRLEHGDLAKIEEKMYALLKEQSTFYRMEMSKKDALAFYAGKNKYKTALIEGLEDGTITFYRQGTFIDLCKGPHLPNTSFIKAFKILSIAGAYWRGDVKQQQLTRIYGISFPKLSLLKEYLDRQEEAKKRDHRNIGKQLGFFTFSPKVGLGLPLWLPKGAFVRERLMDFLRKKQEEDGYLPVVTPHIGHQSLYMTSGHYEKYKEGNFQPIHTEKPGETFLLKPMNCPHHCIIYQSSRRSYQELPLAFAEFGTVYRYEQHGELHGLTRVRGFTQDDAHIFCRPDQVKGQVVRVIDLVLGVFKAFLFTDYEVQVSLRKPDAPSKYIGDKALWDMAEEGIQEAVAHKGLKATIAFGEAAFYGPKIDFIVKDALGRRWQLGTVQIDYQLPIRFGLTYVGKDNQPHRPVMIHRAPFGSLERFIAILLEHTGGKLPIWLCPTQVRVLPVSNTYRGYADEVMQKLKKVGIRAEVDRRNEKVGRKIRDAETAKVPYMLLVGEKELAQQEVAVRRQAHGHQGTMSIPTFIEQFPEDM